MKFNKKRVAIATFIALIFVSFFTISSIQDNQTNAAELSSTRSIDVETGATTLNRSDFNDNFTLSGTVGMRYQVGGAFNPTGPALTDEQTKARYDAETVPDKLVLLH